jgi:hypothetical protein
VTQSRSPRHLAALLLAALALLTSSACSDSSGEGSGGGEGGGGSTAAPRATPSASPGEGADPRTPEALADQVEFTAPPANDPAVEAALDGYEDFLRQFVVAQGLGDPAYPPLLERIDPTDAAFAENVLGNMRADDAAGRYVLGPFSERVLDTTKVNAEGVVIDTCTDYEGRVFHAKDTDEVQGPVHASVVRAQVAMTKPADAWVVSQYSIGQTQDC